DGAIIENLLSGAVLAVFRERVPAEMLMSITDSFDEGTVVHTGEHVGSREIASLLEQIDALRMPVATLTGGDESPGAVASAVEFVLEGLHLSKRLNKDSVGVRSTYRSR
ncbi:MAG: magnesium chelatase, partial [Ilumatobacteraceae bacterium]